MDVRPKRKKPGVAPQHPKKMSPAQVKSDVTRPSRNQQAARTSAPHSTAPIPKREPILAKKKQIEAEEMLQEEGAELIGSSQWPNTTPHRAWYIFLLVLGVVTLGAAAAFAYHRTMPGWEISIFHKINGMHAPEIFTTIAKQMSNAVWGLVGVSFLALLVPKFRLRAWQYAVAIAGGFCSEFVVEHVIDRPRPDHLLHDAVMRAQQSGPGFPSGHETALAALVLTMWFFVAWPWRILLAVLLAGEAWARVFLGVHAPLDVVGGAAVACIVVAVLHLAPPKWRHFFKLM